MAVKKLDLTPIVDEVAAESTVADGFVVFVDKAVAAIEAHKDDPTQVQAVADQLKALRQRLSDALVKGTAAVDETPASGGDTGSGGSTGGDTGGGTPDLPPAGDGGVTGGGTPTV